jgi:hypothetical protein
LQRTAIRHRGTIYRQGEPGRTVFCVLDGQVTIARVSYDGATLTAAGESLFAFGRSSSSRCGRLSYLK